MIPQRLPLEPSVPFYEFETTLDGKEYLIVMRWNERAAAWYMSVYDPAVITADGPDRIRVGIKVVLGVALGWRTVDKRWPRGMLIAIDTGAGAARTKRESGLDDMGSRVQVYYYPAEDAA